MPAAFWYERSDLAGKVYLVGAGPGDPELLTLKGLRVLKEADVVVHDRLVDRRLLSLAPEGAELVDVGKSRGHRRSQEEINLLLIGRAREGKRVVRLKGGDPFVLGRGGEEAEALASAGIPFEVVPGVTSAVAAPAYAGIPVTHRDVAPYFVVVTGSEDPAKESSQVPWDRLAALGGTLVVLMAWEAFPQIMEALRAHGMAPTTPAALVQWGTEPYQRTVTGTLADIAEKGREAGLEPPVVAVVGEVVKLRERLRWFDSRPLFGKRVLVTRTREQASVLSRLLAEEGAEPLELPTIKIEPLRGTNQLDRALQGLRRYRWLVFTSANGVKLFFERLGAQGLDARALGGVKVCAIGPATSACLLSYGVRADLVPERYVAEAVVEVLRPLLQTGDRVLLPRSAEGREVLAQRLKEAGAIVESVPLYRPSVPEGSRAVAVDTVRKADVVAFTSSSTVRNLVKLLEGKSVLLSGKVIACIGPVTAEAARGAGLTVDVVARRHDVKGLVEALKEFYQGKDRT